MALYDIYRYSNFQSWDGTQYVLNILKKNIGPGYQSPLTLGGTPVLRRGKNGRIMGTSLEFPVESATDGALMEFYTSDASTFSVELWREHALIYRGFLVPELYSEPDIAPPYDVMFTSADGLGELKRVTYHGNPTFTIDAMIKEMLSLGGLTGKVFYISYLSCPDLGPEYEFHLFDELGFDFPTLEGESCYDALQMVLETLDAYIMQISGGNWLVVRTADVSALYNADIADVVIADEAAMVGEEWVRPIKFGEGSIDNCWPIGHLTTSIVPARANVKLVSMNNYRDSCLDDSKFERSYYSWEHKDAIVHQYGNSPFCPELLNGGSVTQSVDFGTPISAEFELKIRAFNSGSSPSRIVGYSMEVMGVTPRNVAYYYATTSNKAPNPTYPKEAILIDRLPTSDEQMKGFLSAGSKSPVEVSIKLPAPPSGVMFSRLQLKLTNALVDDTNPNHPVIVEASIRPVNKGLKGYKIVANLNNGAREESEETESMVPYNYRNGESFSPAILSGVPFYLENGELNDRLNIKDTFRDGPSGEVGNYNKTILRGLARAAGSMRFRKTGTLHAHSFAENIEGVPPLMIDDGESEKVYLVESIDWSLTEDEYDVELLSVPDASVTIKSESDIIID